MNEDRNQIETLRQEAAGLPNGATKNALLEEAIRLADLTNDVRTGCRLRSDLMTSAAYSGRPDLLLVAFTWCLAQYDRDSTLYSQHYILWQYKWILSQVWCFPEIRREQLVQMVDDMERRYRLSGHTMHAPWQKRRGLFLDLYDFEQARACHAKFLRQRRDSLSDCAACVASSTVEYHARLGKWSQAIESARPVLDGRLTCGAEPRSTYCKLMLPLMKKDRWDEAEEYHLQAMRLLAKATHSTKEYANQLLYVVLKGDLGKARQIMTRHLPVAVQNVDLSERFEFYLAARLLTDRLRQEGTTSLRISLPAELPATNEKGHIDLDRLAEWFTHEAETIAVRYDARNGNAAMSERVRDLFKLMKLARPVETPARSRRKTQ